MIKSSIEIDGLIAKLTAVEKKGLPGAMMHALNTAAFEVRAEWIKQMPAIFDRPTPLTVRGPLYKKATPDHLESEVFIRPEVAAYLAHHVLGGKRPIKPSERALGHYYVPGPGAQRDRYGNINFNALRAILNAVGGRGPAIPSGFRRTGGARRNRGKRYFIVRAQGEGNLRPGVYERIGKRLKLHLIFVGDAPQYDAQRFDPKGSANSIFRRRFPTLFYDQLSKLVRLN